MAWDVEVTDEFKACWNGLTEAERISVERAVLLLGRTRPAPPISIEQRSERLALFRDA